MLPVVASASPGATPRAEEGFSERDAVNHKDPKLKQENIQN